MNILKPQKILFDKLENVIDILVEFPLTYETAATSKEIFVDEILVKKLKIL